MLIERRLLNLRVADLDTHTSIDIYLSSMIHAFIRVLTVMHTSPYSSIVHVLIYFLFTCTVYLFFLFLSNAHTHTHTRRYSMYLITFTLFIHHPSLPTPSLPLSLWLCCYQWDCSSQDICTELSAFLHSPQWVIGAPYLQPLGITTAFHILQWPKPLLFHQ